MELQAGADPVSGGHKLYFGRSTKNIFCLFQILEKIFNYRKIRNLRIRIKFYRAT